MCSHIIPLSILRGIQGAGVGLTVGDGNRLLVLLFLLLIWSSALNVAILGVASHQFHLGQSGVCTL